MSALWPVQEALKARLDTIPGFNVYDEAAPKGDAGDHIVIGDGTEQPYNSFDHRGNDGVETVHIWTRGNSSMKARQAVELVRAALEDAPLTVAGHTVHLVRVDNVITLKEDEWRHIPMDVRIQTLVAP